MGEAAHAECRAARLRLQQCCSSRAGRAACSRACNGRALPLAKPFTHVIENRSGIITVDTDRTVFGNGMYDGHFNTDLKHDNNGIVRPYALSLFHPAPRDVLMIGLSSGSWAQVVANNPAVATLTIVEINPGYATLIAQEPEVASLLTNPKVTIVIDDGRRWLQPQSGPPFRRHRLEHDLVFPRQRHQPALRRISRPGEGPSQSRRYFLLQYDRLRTRAAHRLSRLRRRSALHQSHGGVGDPDRLGFPALAAHARSLSDRRRDAVRSGRSEDSVLLDKAEAMEASLRPRRPTPSGRSSHAPIYSPAPPG